MFEPTRVASPLRYALAIAVVVVVGIGAVRPAAAQDTPVAPPQGAPAAAWPPPGSAPPVAAPPPAVPATPPAFVVSDGREPPPPIEMVHRARRGWVIGGAVTFGVSWGIAGLTSWILLGSQNGNKENLCTGNCRDFADVLWIPVAGPIIGDIRYPGSEGRAPLIFWSATQAAGVVMLLYGTAGHDVPMRRRVADSGPTLQLLPMLARGASGMTLTARW
jgi:hypothetical protein